MEPKVIVNGKEYPFVLADDLDFGEAADVEGITGQGYDMERPGAKGLMALTFISVRRVDPSVELEDIRRLKGSDIEVVVDQDEEPVPPTSSAASSEAGGPGSEGSSQGSDGSPEPSPEPTGTPV